MPHITFMRNITYLMTIHIRYNKHFRFMDPLKSCAFIILNNRLQYCQPKAFDRNVFISEYNFEVQEKRKNEG